MDALREHVTALLGAVLPTVQGVVMTETQVDDLLGTLADRIVAGGAPEDREATEGDVLAGAMSMLVARHLLAEARADVVRRLVGVKAN